MMVYDAVGCSVERDGGICRSGEGRGMAALMENGAMPLADYRVSLPHGAEGVHEGVARATGWDVRGIEGADPGTEPRVCWRRIRDVSVACVELGREVRMTCRTGAATVVVVTPESGEVEIRIDDDHIELGPGRAAVMSDDRDAWMRWGADCRALVFRGERAALEMILSSRIGMPLGEPLVFEPRMNLSAGYGYSWYEMLSLLIRELDRPGALAEIPRHAQNFGRALLALLLEVQPHSYSERLIKHDLPVQSGQDTDLWPQRLRRAVEIIEEDPGAGISGVELARRLGVTPRSLQINFQKYLRVTPTEYLRNVRLDRVYEELFEASAADTTVDEVIAKWGLRPHGYTKRYYAARFGERAGETLRRSPNALR
jgi:AraC-like DNA-binding protein